MLSTLAQTISQIIDSLDFKNKFIRLFTIIPKYIFSCRMCSSFWITLIMTHSLLLASIIYILMKFILKIEYKYDKTEL